VENVTLAHTVYNIKEPTNQGNNMIHVYIEITNIDWQDDWDGDIAYEQGTTRQFIADIPDRDNLTAEEIDEAIADSLENETGYRPRTWVLNVFEECETA